MEEPKFQSNIKPKLENTPGSFETPEQMKNIEEVFKLSPELKIVIYEALGIIDFSILDNAEFVTLYRSEGKTTDRNDLPIISQASAGRWFTNDLTVAKTYSQTGDHKIYKVDVPKGFYEQAKLAEGVIAKGEIQLPVEVSEKKVILSDSNENSVDKDIWKEFLIFKKEKNEEVTFEQQKEAKELYAKYLETIFPESEVKEIVWHATEAEIDTFKNDQHFGTLKAAKDRIRALLDEEALYDAHYDGTSDFVEKFKNEKAKYYSVLLNMRELKEIEDGVVMGWEKDLLEKDKATSFEYINQHEDPGSKSYIVRNSDQIYVLGSQSDIEGFKKFVESKDQSNA